MGQNKFSANIAAFYFRIENVLWRMENGELDIKTPLKAIVVFVGTNNVDCTPEDIFQGILKLVETIKTKLGDVPVVLPVLFHNNSVKQPLNNLHFRHYYLKANIRILTEQKTRRSTNY